MEINDIRLHYNGDNRVEKIQIPYPHQIGREDLSEILRLFGIPELIQIHPSGGLPGPFYPGKVYNMGVDMPKGLDKTAYSAPPDSDMTATLNEPKGPESENYADNLVKVKPEALAERQKKKRGYAPKVIPHVDAFLEGMLSKGERSFPVLWRACIKEFGPGVATEYYIRKRLVAYKYKSNTPIKVSMGIIQKATQTPSDQLWTRSIIGHWPFEAEGETEAMNAYIVSELPEDIREALEKHFNKGGN